MMTVMLTRYCAWCEGTKTLHEMAIDPQGAYVKRADLFADDGLLARVTAVLERSTALHESSCMSTFGERCTCVKAEAQRLLAELKEMQQP